MPAGWQRREGALSPASLGADRWVRQRGVRGVFSFEQGVLGPKQMATGKTGTRWASSVPGAQLERNVTAAPTAASTVQGPARRQRGARAPHPPPVSPPPKAGALPPGRAGCRRAARTARTSLLGARGTLAALSRPEPHGDVGTVAAGGASAGLPPARCSPRKPPHFRLPCLSLCLLFPVGERGDRKSVV